MVFESKVRSTEEEAQWISVWPESSTRIKMIDKVPEHILALWTKGKLRINTFYE